MKKYMFCLLLAAIMSHAALFADEAEMDIENAEHQLEMTNIQLEQKRAEMGFQLEQEMRKIELEKARLEIELAHRKLGRHPRPKPEGICAIILLVAILNRILVPVWIYKDMRRRENSSVILVLLGILGGLAGLFAYALVRIGDVKTNNARARR